MGLGAKLWNWLNSLDFVATIRRWVAGYRERLNAVGDGWLEQTTALLQAGQIGQAFVVTAAAVMYVLFGNAIFHPQNIVPGHEEALAEIDKFKADPQGYLQEKLNAFGTSPQTKAFTEFVGTIITEPVVSLLETYAADPNPDPHAMARSFHGIASGLPWAAETLDSVLRTVLGDRAPSVGKNIMALYWGLGLGFLGWQTLAPLLSSGLQPNLERYYNKLYRPERFNASQMRDLFALGKRTAPEVQDYLRDQGWRDEDIATWIEIGYRDLSESIIFDAYEKGDITPDELQSRLRRLGYNPADIPLVIRLHEKEDQTEATKYLLSTAKAALKAHKISDIEFREILTGLKYAPGEIDLQIALINEQKEQEERDLSIGQVKEIYNARIIGRDEAVHNLVQLRLSQQNADALVKAWDVEAQPKAARINRGTIVDGYEAGALSRDRALELLQTEAGFTAQNAELILKISEAQAAQAGTPVAEEGPAVSLSLLVQFAQNGLITRAQMEQRTELARFTPEDREAFITLAFQTPVTEPARLSPDVLFDAYNRGVIDLDTLRQRLIATGLTPEDVEVFIAVSSAQLSPSLLSQAYVFGVIDRADFASRLRGAGLSDEDVEIFIRTVELQNPQVFGEFVAQFLRRPSVGSLQLAFQRGLLDEQQFRDRLAALGYSQDAIEIYVFNSQYQEPATPKLLSKADVIRLYRTEKISRANALQRLVIYGYNIEDATLLIESEELLPQDTEIGQAYIAGFVDQYGTAATLQEAGFSFEQIDAFFTAVDLGEI